MSEHEASRTLVKSPPELWTECSDPASLARHLKGSFGEIKITRLEPETAVAWEGEHIRGTVRLEPSGWGTRVVLTARSEGGVEGDGGAGAVGAIVAEEPSPPPSPDPEPIPPEPEPLPPAPSRRGFVARLRAWLSGEAPVGKGEAVRRPMPPAPRLERAADPVPPVAPGEPISGAAAAQSPPPPDTTPEAAIDAGTILISRSTASAKPITAPSPGADERAPASDSASGRAGRWS